MAAKKKRVDPVKQREKRTKIAAIVGVVIFVIAAAYEVPSMLAVMNKKPPVGTTYDPGPSLTPGGLPNVAGGTATATGAPSGQLVDTDVPPVSGAGQLVTFSVFETKNPFAPQVTAADASGAGSSSPSSADKSGADVPTAGGATTTPASTTTTSTTPASVTVVPPVVPPAGTGTSTPPPSSSTGLTTTTVAAPKPSVTISVNGVVSRVSSEGTFPSGAPVFRLASWTKGSAQVAIVGGSYATGDGTLMLHVGQAVTLENQTDGKRYRLELLSTP